jgi:integrase
VELFVQDAESLAFSWATPGTFRRAVATLLDTAGVPLARIADQLGHADPAMTAATYLGRDPLGDKPLSPHTSHPGRNEAGCHDGSATHVLRRAGP